MRASIVDLRYKMKGVLQSLERNEDVKIYYHNRWIGTSDVASYMEAFDTIPKLKNKIFIFKISFI